MTITLRCRCGIEVGIVRLNADTLALGHRVNPRQNRHAVRLARDASPENRQLRVATGTAAGRHREGPNVGREDVSADGPSNLIATGKRPARKGSTRSRVTPSGISSSERSRRDGTPLNRTPAPLSAGPRS